MFVGDRSGGKKGLEPLEPAIEIIHINEMEMDESTSVLNPGKEGEINEDHEPRAEESPDKSFFDYTTTFLDETNQTPAKVHNG